MKRRRFSPCMRLVFAAVIILSLGIASGIHAQSGNTNKKPIRTKSSQKAAVWDAAQKILALQGATGITPMSMPASPTDETKVPHYFGPFPNWANSPFTVPDVKVDIVGDGTGATATATVGANGTITALTLTSPGSGYTAANVLITGGGTGAQASATVNTATPAVTAVQVVDGGAGYVHPAVVFSGGGATTQATATAYGGVDAVALTNPGSGYTMPTVDFDLPDDPNGVQARAHAVCIEANCAPATQGATVTITGIVVDDPGSGYATAPNVVIRDGTVFNPINNGGSGAQAKATLGIQNVVLNTYGTGYTGVPTVNLNDTAPAPTKPAVATALTDLGAVTSITLTAGGSGYLTTGGIKKFQDGLPMLCMPGTGQTFANCTNNNLGQHIPIAVPDTATFSGDPTRPNADYYVIGVVQHRERMNSSLPAAGSMMREYVQSETPANKSFSRGVLLSNDLVDGSRH